MGVRIALIGYGEVGKIFSADLRAGGADVSAYDLLFDGPDGAARRAEAEAAGVAPGASAAAACRGADVVISAVTAASAAAVAESAAAFLAPDQLFLDVNSASPATKREAARRVTAGGARYVEGAVMAAVPGPRLAVPILGGGPDAARAAALLNPLGMRITPAATEFGRASAMKLCRSIMIKGIEALIIDCATAAARWEVEDEVFASLGATFPSVDWRQLAVDMPGRVHAHGLRRAAEMREAGQMLEDLGLDPALALAVAAKQQAHARPKAAPSPEPTRTAPGGPGA